MGPTGYMMVESQRWLKHGDLFCNLEDRILA